MKTTIRYLKPYSGAVIAGLILKFIGAVAELFLPLLLEYIINDIAKNQSMTHDIKIRWIIILGGAMLFCALTALLSNIFANRLTVISSGNMTHDIRRALFEKTSYLSCRQVDEFSVPSLISRLTSDTYYVNQTTVRTLRLGVRAPILILGGLILTFLREPVLASVLLTCVPIVGLTIFFITKKGVPQFFEVQRRQDNMVRDVQENITGVRVIKALDKSDYETEKFDKVANELAAKELKANKIMSLSNPLATLILNLGLVAVIVVGAIRGTKSGTVLAFLQYFVIILNAMIALSKIFVGFSRGMASASRIEKVLSCNTDEFVDPTLPQSVGNMIEFKDVCFSYNGVKDNLSDISFALKRGQTLGIIGPTGSGKSTIVNLLMRFYDCRSGNIYVDGRNVISYDPRELKRKFGVAFQSDFLMAASIFDNVDYGRNLSKEQVEKALVDAHADEFVSKLQGGTDYNLAQKANNISGGQKQRLLIARALAGDPEILILDDSSSALDYATEAALRKTLNYEYSGVTMVIVAQRISSIKNADLILVLDDGKIIGKGTHDELLACCEEYRIVYESQMGGHDAEA